MRLDWAVNTAMSQEGRVRRSRSCDSKPVSFEPNAVWISETHHLMSEYQEGEAGLDAEQEIR